MITFWFLGVFAVLFIVIAWIAASRRGDRLADLGAVSHQWISEQRLGSGSNSRH